ncbi:MAG: AbrB/MazE/SpoVT family DNA-binding domain-containing protein [Chitinispirillaceae bacterium]|nr:AbrB/MazE/SpoVT family DNA-binding domain-containing protein [Chitinispirillaceae bacterium]
MCIYIGGHDDYCQNFKNGNSQAVRLPKEYRLEAEEVSINRIGNVIMMVPKSDPWSGFSEGIREVGDDFPSAIRTK